MGTGGWYVGIDAIGVGQAKPITLAPTRRPFLKSFVDSPFGVNYYSTGAGGTLCLYEITPALLSVTLNETGAITLPSNAVPLTALSGTQMIVVEQTTSVDSHSLGVLTRSGSSLSYSGGQQTVAGSFSRYAITRIDATRFLHSWTDLSGVCRMDFLSVSGSTISVDGTHFVSGGGITTLAAPGIRHYGGNGYGFDLFLGNDDGNFSVNAYGFIAPTTFLGFAIYSLPFSTNLEFMAGTLNSPEIVFETNFSFNGLLGFYYASGGGGFFGHTPVFNGVLAEGLHATPYYTLNGVDMVTNTDVGGAELTQTHQTLSYVSKPPIYATGFSFPYTFSDGSFDVSPSVSNSFEVVRHGAPGGNLGATLIVNNLNGYDLRAFTW